ncbi:hypothetical protein PB72LOC_03356 [Pectobacterium atrosepticum]|nr:hypothetical protein PB72LOC_03356 [Pectobacterium atrosepticum]
MRHIVGHRHQDILYITHHAKDGFAVEQVGGVDQPTVEAIFSLDKRQRQIKVGAMLRPLNGRERKIGQRQGLCWGVVQRQHHLENGAVTEAASGLQDLYDLFERQGLMGVGVQRPLTHLIEQICDGVAAARLGAQCQRVDEEADHALQLLTGTVGNRGADDDIVLPAEAGQHHRPGGQQRHKQGRALLPVQCMKATELSRIQMEGNLIARIALYRRAGPVGRDLQQGRCPLQLIAPVVTQVVKCFPLQPLTLPDGVVGVLNRQWR